MLLKTNWTYGSDSTGTCCCLSLLHLSPSQADHVCSNLCRDWRVSDSLWVRDVPRSVPSAKITSEYICHTRTHFLCVRVGVTGTCSHWSIKRNGITSVFGKRQSINPSKNKWEVYSCMIQATMSNGALSGGLFEKKSSRVLANLREIRKATQEFASLNGGYKRGLLRIKIGADLQTFDSHFPFPRKSL